MTNHTSYLVFLWNLFILLKLKTFYWKYRNQNGQIPLLAKIISVLPLFEKYLIIYHLFESRLLETQVWHGTQVSNTLVL